MALSPMTPSVLGQKIGELWFMNRSNPLLAVILKASRQPVQCP